METNKIIELEINNHIETSMGVLKNLIHEISLLSINVFECLQNNNKVILFGNGGSASDAQHIAAELVGRFKTERKGLPAISLNTDTSIITALGNDYGYEKIFSRQVNALANEGDLVIGISTGGSSVNVINGLREAKTKKCKIFGLSGKSGGEFNQICDLNIVVPSKDTARIQEMHILIGHIICHLVDLKFSN